MSTSTSLLLILLLLLANGFYVAAEFALVKARNFRINALAREGSATALLTVKIQSNLEAYLAACQLGITMASLGLGWVGEPTVARLLAPFMTGMGFSESVVHTTSFVVGFLVFSSLHIVLGEQVPKTFAIRKPEPVSLWVAYPLHLSYLAAWPLNWLLNRASNGILSLLGVSPVSHADVLSGDELKGLVSDSSEHGEIHEDHAVMLRNLFEFDQRQISRVMVPRMSVHCIELNGDPKATLELLRQTEHSRFPVIDTSDKGAIVGILLAADLHRAMLDGEPEPWKEIARFCREPLVVPEAHQVARLFELMRQGRVHMALVVDEYGEFVGIVTLEDLLEEIVGEIFDETDNEATNASVEIIDGQTWKSDGLVSLSDLEKITGLKVENELDANTLSGLIMDRLERMPMTDDTLDIEKYRITVIDMRGNRVGTALLERIIEETSDASSPI